jgi:hypothetical protein
LHNPLQNDLISPVNVIVNKVINSSRGGTFSTTVTSIAHALLVRNCYFNRLFVRFGHGYLSGGEDFFDGRDDPMKDSRLTEGVPAGQQNLPFRFPRFLGCRTEGDWHDGFKFEDIGNVINKRMGFPRMDETDRRCAACRQDGRFAYTVKAGRCRAQTTVGVTFLPGLTRVWNSPVTVRSSIATAPISIIR